MKNDATIARNATLKPIAEVAASAGIPQDAIVTYGRYKAKLSRDYIASLDSANNGKLILVTAISPTSTGEGKTLTAIGLGDGLNRNGQSAMVCLREPSLGPCFGLKGGATGGGYAQVAPADEINLHFTGDFHAVTSAHNLLAAMVDNHYYWQREDAPQGDRITFKRVLDMNDRSLRRLVTAAGETGFDITPASEVMAILCLAADSADLKKRLARIAVGYRDDRAIYADAFDAIEAMAVLLKDAMQPNLVQSLENNPVLVHGGPFANIAHGCNSLIATRTALRLADYVVTEAGFGADLGAEKFFNITCRTGGMTPAVAVVVASVKALKEHGGAGDLAIEDPDAVTRGAANLRRHLANIAKFGVPSVVAINRFDADTDAEVQAVRDACHQFGVPAVECSAHHRGGEGAAELAAVVKSVADQESEEFRYLYSDDESLSVKIERIAKDIYGAGQVEYSTDAEQALQQLEAQGVHLPVCIAKTPYSFSIDAKVKGAPEGHTLKVKELTLANGAGYVVVSCGSVMRMPGLPREPAAQRMHVDSDGTIHGLS